MWGTGGAERPGDRPPPVGCGGKGRGWGYSGEMTSQCCGSSRKWGPGGHGQWGLEHGGDVAAAMDRMEREKYSRYPQLGRTAQPVVR